MDTSESHLVSHCEQPYNSLGSHLVFWRYFTIQTLSLYEHLCSLEPQSQCLIVSHLDIHQLHTFFKSSINYKLNIVGVRPHSKSWNMNPLVGSPWRHLGNLQRLFSTKRRNTIYSVVVKSKAKSTCRMSSIKRSKASLVSPRKVIRPRDDNIDQMGEICAYERKSQIQLHHNAKGINKGMSDLFIGHDFVTCVP